ncbi:MAG TPA: hypothetical protein V6D05_01000 [Stenomitos sp.]
MRGLMAAVLGAVLVGACGAPPAGGGGGGGPAPRPLPSPTLGILSGDWALVHTLNPLSGIGAPTVLGGTLRLLQNGTALTGTYSPAQAPTAVVVTGTVSGTRLSLQVGPVTLSSGVTLNLADTGALESNLRTASGSTAVTGVLGGTTLLTSGSFTMTRQSGQAVGR